MRKILAFALRHLAERMDPAPPPAPCPLQHYPVVQPSWPTYPYDTWVTTEANTTIDPNLPRYTINTVG